MVKAEPRKEVWLEVSRPPAPEFWKESVLGFGKCLLLRYAFDGLGSGSRWSNVDLGKLGCFCF